MNRRAAFTAFVFAAGAAGCQSDPPLRPKPVEVTGTATSAGKPLAGMVVRFEPNAADRMPNAATTDKTGAFKVSLIPGPYMTFVEAPQGSAEMATFKSLPAKTKSATEDRVVEIPPAGGAITVPID